MADKQDFVGVHRGGDYNSEFENDSETERRKKKRYDLIPKRKTTTSGIAPKEDFHAEYSREEGRKQRFHLLSLDAFSRHKKFVNDYLLFYGGSRSDFKRDTSKDKNDHDVIRENHQFLWTDEDEEDTWEKRLAKQYYDKLFKEYCITDLSRYKENKIAMRWRIEKEVVDGKGQFICGSKKCTETEGLKTWEANFGYVEQGEKKNALVKLRLCPDCSYKLNYHHRKKEVTRKRKSEKSSSKHKSKKPKGKEREEETPEPKSQTESKSVAESPTESSKEKSEEGIWSGPAKIVEEKSREEEFEDYFEDMFL